MNYSQNHTEINDSEKCIVDDKPVAESSKGDKEWPKISERSKENRTEGWLNILL